MHFSFFGLRLGSPFLSKMQIILRPEGLRENSFNCNCLSLWRVLWGKELALSIRQSQGLHKKLTDSPNYGQFRNSLLTCMCLNSRRKLEHQEEAHSSISWAHGNQAIRSGMQLSTQYKTLNTFTSYICLTIRLKILMFRLCAQLHLLHKLKSQKKNKTNSIL